MTRAWALAALALLAPTSALAEGAAASPEVTVKAPPRRRDPARVTLLTDEARHVPGTQGDPLKVAESLPGVARPALGADRLVLWGAAPGDSRVYVDGVEIPALYHAGGLRSTLHADLVRSLDLLPGTHGAEHGRALGGLVRVTTRALPEEGVHAALAADLLDGSASLGAALGDRLRLGLAARVGYLDRLLDGALSASARDYFPLPRYHDYQAKLSLRLRDDEELAAVLLGSGDRLRRALGSPDPAAVRAETSERSFQRFYWQYTRAIPEGSSLSVTPFFGRDQRALTASFGAVPAGQSVDALVYGLRASYRAPFGEALAVTAGLDLQGTRAEVARSGSLTLPAREGDPFVFGQAPGADVNTDRWSSTIADLAPHLSAELRLGPLLITPGLRVESFLIEGSRLTPRVASTPTIGFSRLESTVDPRLSLSWSITRRLGLAAAAGIHHQAPAPEDLGAVFGTPGLVPARAMKASLAATAELGDTLSVELTGHHAQLDRLVVRSRLGTPHLGRALTQDGEGRSYGAQILVRQRPWKGLSGWVAYALSRSERRYVGDGDYRLFDHDQTHVLTAVASYAYRGFGAGARFRYSSGEPRTPVIGAFYEATFGEFQPLFGALNSTRLPDFYQLDLRVDQRFSWARWSLELSLDLLNLTYHRNVEELAYSYDYRERRFITGLPILAVLGARIVL